jgi:hypothetical protein
VLKARGSRDNVLKGVERVPLAVMLLAAPHADGQGLDLPDPRAVGGKDGNEGSSIAISRVQLNVLELGEDGKETTEDWMCRTRVFGVEHIEAGPECPACN